MIRIAAASDIHCTRTSRGALAPLLSAMAAAADVLVICGDLTDHGHPDEAKVLAHEMTGVRAPVLSVLGNHDYESGHVQDVKDILLDAGMLLMDGDAHEVKGVGFAGAKGFGGGFARGTLSSFGEPAIKAFVQEAVDEAMKLERALQRLDGEQKIAILHYSPIRATIDTEPVEIHPFLGSGRLEEPLNRYQVTACVHGHAHAGVAEGRTGGNVPVYNVSMALMKKHFPEHPPFRLLEVQVAKRAEAPAATMVGTPV